MIRGDDNNRNSVDDSWFGVSEEASQFMPEEIVIKHHLEMANDALFKLLQPIHVHDMNAMFNTKKPSATCVSVFKAVKCLLPDISEKKVIDLISSSSSLVKEMKKSIDINYNSQIIS